jgi:Protein of unknown function (DUF3572)
MSESSRFRQQERALAESVAASALGFIASDEERLGRFVAVTGVDPGEIRTAARSPGFLAGVLQHVMDDDRLAAAFAEHADLTPERLMRAAAALGSHWERDTP